MAFGTLGTTGGAVAGVADLLLHLIEIMSDAKAAKEYLTKLKKALEEIETEQDELSKEQADFANEKAAHRTWLEEQKKELIEQQTALQRQTEAADKQEAERQNVYEQRTAGLARGEAAVIEQKKDFDERMKRLRQVAG